jgi:hypothetical protein
MKIRKRICFSLVNIMTFLKANRWIWIFIAVTKKKEDNSKYIGSDSLNNEKNDAVMKFRKINHTICT